jgi:hypothetical protein
MDERTRENWQKVKSTLEAAGKTDSIFYIRAVAICKGGSDPFESDQSNLSSRLTE